MARITVSFVEFRGKNRDQPRYKPSPGHAALGLKARPLRHSDGRWLTAIEALSFIETEIEPEVERRRQLREAGRRIRPRAARAFLTVSRMLELYADMKQKDAASPHTVRFYRQGAGALSRFDPDIYSAPAEALTQSIVFDLYERMRKGSTLSMANATMRTLSAAYGYFIPRGKVTMPAGNPCIRMRRKALAPRVRAGSRPEMTALVRAAELCRKPMLGIAITLGLWTGQRQGDRLDMIEGGTSATRIILRQSKTKRFVSIPHSPELVAALALSRELKQAMADSGKHVVIGSTIVVSDVTARRYNEHTYRHDFTHVRAAAVAGIRDAGGGWLLKPCPSLNDFTDQDLRDTAVTWLVRAGCDIFEVASITGHDLATVHQILKHYLADHPERADNAIAKMVKWFEQQPLEHVS